MSLNNLQTGDIRLIANLLRERPIAKKYRNTIADILEGKRNHIDLSSEPARSYKMRLDYEEFLQRLKSVRIFEQRMNEPILPYNNFPPKNDKQWVIEQIAKNYYQGNYESARRVIHRKIKDYGWPTLPDEFVTID